MRNENTVTVTGDVQAILSIFVVVRELGLDEQRKESGRKRRKQVAAQLNLNCEMKVNRMRSESWSKHPASLLLFLLFSMRHHFSILIVN